MKRFRIISVILVAALIVFIFVNQHRNQKAAVLNQDDNTITDKYTVNFLDVFDTSTDITGFAASQNDFNKEANLIKEQLTYYNNLYDIYNDYDGLNNIKTINDNAGVQAVEVEPEIIELLEFGKEM